MSARLNFIVSSNKLNFICFLLKTATLAALNSVFLDKFGRLNCLQQAWESSLHCQKMMNDHRIQVENWLCSYKEI